MFFCCHAATVCVEQGIQCEVARTLLTVHVIFGFRTTRADPRARTLWGDDARTPLLHTQTLNIDAGRILLLGVRLGAFSCKAYQSLLVRTMSARGCHYVRKLVNATFYDSNVVASNKVCTQHTLPLRSPPKTSLNLVLRPSVAYNEA